MHWAFFDAPGEVLAAVGRIVEGGHRRGGALRGAEDDPRSGWRSAGGGTSPERWAEVAAGRRRRRGRWWSEGHVHDLEAIRDEVNMRYFGGRHWVVIGWSRVGKARKRSRRRTIKLGSWSADERTVRIHPALDHASVPRFVVASVVHHELLHAEMDPEVTCTGRRRLHTPEFRRREREFAEHERARKWIDRHMGSSSGAGRDSRAESPRGHGRPISVAAHRPSGPTGTSGKVSRTETDPGASMIRDRRSRARPSAALLLLAAALPASPAAATPGAERVARLCEAWTAVRYLHPSLAYTDLDWDAAFVEAAPRAWTAAGTEGAPGDGRVHARGPRRSGHGGRNRAESRVPVRTG